MTRAVRHYRTFGIALIAAGAVIAVSPPTALADGGGAGGSGTGALTGPGGTTLGSISSSVDGSETIPGGAPKTLGCLTGGCSAGLTTVTNVASGPGGTPPPAGLYIVPVVQLPQPSVIACVIGQCHGSGSLAVGGGVTTPIVGATGGLNTYIHG
jgi:hypothetical protein